MKKILTVVIILQLLLLIPKILISCSCDIGSPSYPFCNSPYSNNKDVLIAEAVIIEKPEHHDLKVIILDELGFAVEEDTILILGQDGLNCGETMTIFEIGDTLIFRLLNWEIKDAVNSEVYNWYLDGCDVNFLSVENGFVNGYINEGVVSEKKEDFKQNIETCTSFEVGLQEIEFDLRVYPNPFTDKILIDGSTENISLIEVYNTNGQILASEIPKDINNIEVFLKESITGLYFINIHKNNYVISRKILRE